MPAPAAQPRTSPPRLVNIGWALSASAVFKVLQRLADQLICFDPKSRCFYVKLGGDNFSHAPHNKSGTRFFEQVALLPLFPKGSHQSVLLMQPLAFVEAKETLPVVSAILKIILPGLRKTITVRLPASEGGGTRELEIRYLLSSDGAFASLYFSHQGSAATYFCIWCTISKDELNAAMAAGVLAPAHRAHLAVHAAVQAECSLVSESAAAAVASAAVAASALTSTAGPSPPIPPSTAGPSSSAPPSAEIRPEQSTHTSSASPSPPSPPFAAVSAQSAAPSSAISQQPMPPAAAALAQSASLLVAGSSQPAQPPSTTAAHISLGSSSASAQPNPPLMVSHPSSWYPPSLPRLAAMRVATAGAAELSTAFAMRTGLSMTEVGNLISPYLYLDSKNNVKFHYAQLLSEGDKSALGAAIEGHVLKAQGGKANRTSEHVRKGLDVFRCSITAAPLSDVMAIEDYRIEPLHAVLNCINNLWLLTAGYYEQLIGNNKGSWAAAMAKIGLVRQVTNFNGQECQEVIDRRAEFMQHLSLHPMHGVLVKVWALMRNMLSAVNVVDMERHTPELFATFAESTAQYEAYLSKYLSQPFPQPNQHDLSILSPTCGTKAHPLVSMPVKQYDHALMHHALGQFMAEAFSIASAGSSWLEAGNKRWKRCINFHTTLGGGWPGERRDQLRQVLERVSVECHPDISKYVIPKQGYKCGKCHKPKLNHECTFKIQQRIAAAADMAADLRSPAAELLPPLPCHLPGFPTPSEGPPVSPSSPPSSPPVYSLSHQSPMGAPMGAPSPPPPFLSSPNKEVMLDRLYTAVEATLSRDPTITVPTTEEFMMVAKVAMEWSLFEQHMLDDGYVVLLWVEKEKAKLAAHNRAQEAIHQVNTAYQAAADAQSAAAAAAAEAAM